MLALLGDFGEDDPQKVITNITAEVLQNATGELEREQRKNQLRILSQLRILVSDNIKFMESVSTFFKEEKDFLYRRGEEKKSLEVVKNLLIEFDQLPIAKIASLAGVTEDFVLKVKEILK